MSTPIPNPNPPNPKKNRYHIDLTLKHMKAITLFQILFKQRRQHISSLNNRLMTVYSTLISVMNSLTNHYANETMSQEDYTKLMLSVDEVLSSYEKLPNPVTHETLSDPEHANISVVVSFLEYQTIELVKKCGASSCYDVLKILIGSNWSVGLRQNFTKLMKFYNTMFIPRSVRMQHSSDGHEIPLLPDIKKSAVYTESALIGLHGAELIIPFFNQLIIIRGYFRKDPLNIARVGGTLGEKLVKLQEKTSSVANETFKNRYIHQISLRDFLSLDVDQLAKMVHDSHNELKKLLDHPLSYVTEQFTKSKLENKSKLLTLLLLSEDQRYASNLIRSLSADDTKQLSEVFRYLHWSVQKIFNEVSKGIDSDVLGGGTATVAVEELPYDVRIDSMKADSLVKQKARDKLKEIRGSREGNEKATKFLDGLLRIPFGVFKHEKMLRFMSGFKDEVNTVIRQLTDFTTASPDSDMSYFFDLVRGFNAKTANDVDRFCQIVRSSPKLREISTTTAGSEDDVNYSSRLAGLLISLEGRWGDYKLARQSYLSNVRDKLECIHGQRDAKRKVESLIAQWINGEMEGAVFGFRGPPGTGKTSLAKEGLAQCLTDEDGTPRPFAFIALGGSTNGSILEGHSYTYVGSKWGRIAEVLMETKCMNPIIYFDELDKISGTPHGREIIGILTHLTDPQQNDAFTDRYFDGIKIDLSKALIIFSYNDPKLIDSILLDRITEVNFKHLIRAEKIHIGLNYMLPKILASVGYTKSEIVFSEKCIEHIVESYVYEAGVRGLKEKLYEIIREINTRRLQNETKNPLPIVVSLDLIDDILERKNRIIIRTIPKKPQVGWVNGLYATASGIGGLTVIQVFETISEQKFSLELTGALGDVMKESIKCAKTITWQILPTEIKKLLNEEWKVTPYGLHIHCPEAATPKDGPSAGAAITTAIVSYLCKMPVRNYIAMTGEIDLHGHVHAIGGLQSKIEGAIRAGAKIVLVPRENGEEWDELAPYYQDKVTVVKIDCIEQVLQLCLINRTDAKFNVTIDPFEERDISVAWELVCKLDQEKTDLPPETPMFTSLRTPMVPVGGGADLPPLLELPPTGLPRPHGGAAYGKMK